MRKGREERQRNIRYRNTGEEKESSTHRRKNRNVGREGRG